MKNPTALLPMKVQLTNSVRTSFDSKTFDLGRLSWESGGKYGGQDSREVKTRLTMLDHGQRMASLQRKMTSKKSLCVRLSQGHGNVNGINEKYGC